MTVGPTDNPLSTRAFWAAAAAALALLVAITTSRGSASAPGEDATQSIVGATLTAKVAVLVGTAEGPAAAAYGELVLQALAEVDREGTPPARARALRRTAIWCDFQGLPCAKVALASLSGISAEDRAPAPEDEVALLRELTSGEPISPERVEPLAARLPELKLGWFDHLLRERLYRHAGDAPQADAALAQARSGALAAMAAIAAFMGVLGTGTLAWLVMLFLPFFRRSLRQLSEHLEEADTTSIADAARLLTIFVLFLAAHLLLAPAARKLGVTAPVTALGSALQALAGEVILGAVVLVAYVALWWNRGPRPSLGFENSTVRRSVGGGLLTYLLMMPALIVVLIPLSALFNRIKVPAQGHPIVDQIQASMGDPRALALWFVVAAVCAPLLEEAVFRGALQKALRARFGPGGAIAISSFAFAVIHPQVGVGLVGVLVIGLVLALLREQQRSLWPSVVVHAINNAVTLALTLGLLAS